MWVRIAANYRVLVRASAACPLPDATRLDHRDLHAPRRNVRDARRNIELMRAACSTRAVRRAARFWQRGAAARNGRLKNAIGSSSTAGDVARRRSADSRGPAVRPAGVRGLAHARGQPTGSSDGQRPEVARAGPAPASRRQARSRTGDASPRLPATALARCWSVMIPTYNCAGYLRETLAARACAGPRSGADADRGRRRRLLGRPRGGRREARRRAASGFFRQPANVGHTAQLQHLPRALARSARAPAARRRLRCARASTKRWSGPSSSTPRSERPSAATSPSDERRPLAERRVRSSGPRRASFRDWLGTDRRRPASPVSVHGRAPRRRTSGSAASTAVRRGWARTGRCGCASPPTTPSPTSRSHSRSIGSTRLSQTGPLLRSGANAQDLRRVIAINRERFDPRTAEEVSRRALRATALGCVRRARRLLAAGDSEAMWAQLREALRSDASPRVVAGAGVVVAGRVALGRGLLDVRRGPDGRGR